MKKILFCLMFLGALVSCEQQNMNVSKKNVQQLDKNTALSKIQKLCNDFTLSDSVKTIRNRNNPDTDWELILGMDGTGASLAYLAAIESFLFEAAIPAAAIAAVVFSVAEYERQQQSDSTANNFYPAIDPLCPIKAGWQYDVIPINHESAALGASIGYYHNAMLSEIVTNNIPLNTTSIGVNYYTVSQIYGYLIDDTYVYDAFNLLSQSNLNPLSLSEYLDSDELTFLNYYNSVIPFLSESDRASFTSQFVDIISCSSLDHDDALLCSIMTTYYSSFIWNRLL